MLRHGMCLALLATLVALPSAAQNTGATAWPEHVVKVVVPYGAGGGVDLFTRPIVNKLSEQTGAQLIVDNRPGAGGTIGVKMVARSKPDGYTLLGGGVHQPMAEHLYPKRGYDFGKDFVPIAVTAVVPNVLVVHPNIPFRQVKDLIAYAKANPGKLTYCSAGTGTAPHVIAELFKMEAGVRILHVPHSGTAASYVTLLGGNCDMTFDGLGTASAHIKSGRVIPLALTSAKPSVYFPEIPTMAEAGGPAMDAGTWYGLWAPAGTPPQIVARLNREVAKVWPTARTCTKTAGLKMLFLGHGLVSVKQARNAGLMVHQRLRCPGVEDCRRPEENLLKDSYGRRPNIRKINFFMHFQTGHKHAVSARRSHEGALFARHQGDLGHARCRDSPLRTGPAPAICAIRDRALVVD